MLCPSIMDGLTEDNIYTPLQSTSTNAIFNMAEQILASLNKAELTWLSGFTKKILQHYGGEFGFSPEKHAWQILDSERNLIISIGLSESVGDYIYTGSIDGSSVSGRVSSLSDLKALFPNVFRGI